MDDLCPQCQRPLYEAGIGFHCLCRACLTETQRADLDDMLERLPAPAKYTFVLDAYIRIIAHSKVEADRKAAEIERTIDGMPRCSLQLFDAYGVEDAETGDELRQVH